MPESGERIPSTPGKASTMPTIRTGPSDSAAIGLGGVAAVWRSRTTARQAIPMQSTASPDAAISASSSQP